MNAAERRKAAMSKRIEPPFVNVSLQRHPLRERLSGALFSCSILAEIRASGRLGRYRVTRNAADKLEFEFYA